MITVEQALGMVLQRTAIRPAVTVDLHDALGLVLAADVASDVDSPPHDKSLMDGYAVMVDDLAAGPAELHVIEEVTAGATPTREITRGTATRIMTGAPIPPGADAVVMVEHTEPVEGQAERVRISGPPARAGQNIMRRGASLEQGDVVLTGGTPLRPIEVGLLAEVGRARVEVTPRPRVALLSTGNELVPADQRPGAGQIRNSNGPMLAALVARAGGRCLDLGIGRDDRKALLDLVARGLEADLLVLSGGVSAGVLDLVPGVLAELGVEQVFHKVALKPGKPVWFGVLPSAAGGDTLVFGLPGNPVSSLVCFELFVRPAIAKLAGRSPEPLVTRAARLTTAHQHHGERPTYFPARWTRDDEDAPQVELLQWKGSADLRTLSGANCLACFPPGQRSYEAGDEIKVAQLP